MPVLAVLARVLEERRGRAGGEEAAGGVGEGDVDGERERGEEVEQGDAEQLRLQHRRAQAPHAHPPHFPGADLDGIPGVPVHTQNFCGSQWDSS